MEYGWGYCIACVNSNNNNKSRQGMQASTHTPQRKRIKNYTICLDRPIGSGSVGQVYLCFDTANPEQVYACKIINKSQFEHNEYMQETIRREALIHRKLKHSNIVNLIDMQETKNNIYFVQEYCEGKTLKDVLAARKRLGEEQVLMCMRHICLGYSELVQKGIIHRDLKPENILIGADQDLKIGDFGFAKQIASQKQLVISMVGSPIYMAPQILRGEKYNSKCDVWSFGIIVFQLLYGHFPWHKSIRGPQNHSTLLKVLTQPLVFPQEPVISDKLKQFIQQCLQLEEKQRISWLQIFRHEIFSSEPKFASIAQQYTNNAFMAVELLNILATRVKPHHLVGAFLQFKLKALDYELFNKIIKYHLIPEASEPQISIMYQLFDKDCNGVIDLQEFVGAFQVCDQRVLALLNQLVDAKDMVYDQMVDEFLFKNTARGCQHGHNEEIIDEAYRIICQIQYSDYEPKGEEGQ